MHFLTLFASLAIVPHLAIAQGSLPSCAQSCLGGSNNLPSSCSATDIACICKDNSFIDGIACCVESKCSGSDIQAAIGFAQQLCAGAGVTVATTLPASCPSGTATAASSTGAAGATPATTTGAHASGNSTLSATPSLTATSSAATGVSTAGAPTAAILGNKYGAIAAGAMGAAVIVLA